MYLYRAKNFEINSIEIIGETPTIAYAKEQIVFHADCKRNACHCRLIRKRNTRDSFVSTNKDEVLSWLENRRTQRINHYKQKRAELIRIELSNELVWKIQLSREEIISIEKHFIDLDTKNSKVVKTLTQRDMLQTHEIGGRRDGVQTRKVNLYIRANGYYKVANYWEQLVSGTWIIVGDNSDSLYSITDWIDKRIEWLNNRKWS